MGSFGADTNIVIIGFKGCGKTSVGQILANRLNLEFIDTDAYIEIKYLKETGDKLHFREIYYKKGRDYFRKLESDVAIEVLRSKDKVISLGGGTLFSLNKPLDLLASEIVVYLYVSPDILYERIMKNGIPSFFEASNPRESFDRLFSKRSNVYTKLAKIVIDNTNITKEEAATIILKKM